MNFAFHFLSNTLHDLFLLCNIPTKVFFNLPKFPLHIMSSFWAHFNSGSWRIIFSPEAKPGRMTGLSFLVSLFPPWNTTISSTGILVKTPMLARYLRIEYLPAVDVTIPAGLAICDLSKPKIMAVDEAWTTQAACPFLPEACLSRTKRPVCSTARNPCSYSQTNDSFQNHFEADHCPVEDCCLWVRFCSGARASSEFGKDTLSLSLSLKNLDTLSLSLSLSKILLTPSPSLCKPNNLILETLSIQSCYSLISLFLQTQKSTQRYWPIRQFEEDESNKKWGIKRKNMKSLKVRH